MAQLAQAWWLYGGLVNGEQPAPPARIGLMDLASPAGAGGASSTYLFG